MPWKFGIIGMGPRGLALFDRLSNTFAALNSKIEVHIFEPGEPGSGVHARDQPDYLLTNTVCSQITAFGQVTKPSLRPIGCPSLFEWARARSYEVTDGDNVRRLVHENDYLPRAVLGRYLAWAFQYILRNLPEGVTAVLHRRAAADIIRLDRSQIEIATEDGARVRVDAAVVCTGHALRNRCGASAARSGRLWDAYPVEAAIGELPDGHRIGVEGLGLTALDVVSAATVGRGGSFIRNAQSLAYRPSGRELQIVCFSRSGIPLLARARNQKSAHWNYQPLFATKQRIDRLRQSTAASRRQLDFEKDVLPLIQAEMELVYYTTLIRGTEGPDEAERFAEEYVSLGPQSEELQAYISRIPEAARFSFSSLTAAVPASVARNGSEYRLWLVSKLRDDVAEARRGNIDSPIKAACDVLRDIRPTIRHAVDLAGLTPESHRFFIDDFVPTMNRLAVGPPLQKLEELCALIEAGIIDVGTGPIESVTPSAQGRYSLRGAAGEREVDLLVSARIPLSHAGSQTNGIVQRLINSGLARPFRNGAYAPGGIDVTETYRLIAKDGQPSPCIWALGTPVEGPRFYTFVLSAPGATSSPLMEAQICIDDVLRTAAERQLLVQNDAGELLPLAATPSAA